MICKSAVEPQPYEQPEYELIGAILQQALEDLRCENITGVRRRRSETVADCSRRLKRRARRWFQSERKTAGSFLWCCDLLGLNADAVRRSIHNVSNTTTKKIGPRVHHLQNKLASENSLDQARLSA